jgi:hypothetical protein
MSSAGDLDIVTSTRSPGHLSAVPAPRERRHAREQWLRIDDQCVMALHLAGHPGNGRTASLRRQPVSIVDGRMEGGDTRASELVCPRCGDHPHLDYSEVSSRLQQIRGPYPLEADVTAHEKRLRLLPKGHEVRPGRSSDAKPAAASSDETASGYRHEAFLYSGMAQFLRGASSLTKAAAHRGA